MPRFTQDRWILFVFLCFVIAFFAVLYVRNARGQERLCGPFDGDHVVAWLVCSWEGTSDRVDALESRVAQLEAQIAQLQTAQRTFDERAWAKASDRLFLFQQQSTAYEDKWFYDEIYKRFRIHVCRSGIPHNGSISC